MSHFMLGVDIGTTSTKTVVFTLDGRVVAQHAVEYPVLCTEPGMSEQDPLQMFDAVLGSIAGAVAAAKAAPGDIELVSFSAAMHSLIALDGDDRLLSNSITWGDIRASVWAERIKNEFDAMPDPRQAVETLEQLAAGKPSQTGTDA